MTCDTTDHDDALPDCQALDSMRGYHRFKYACMALAGIALALGLALAPAHA